MNERDFHIRLARVYLAQLRHRRQHAANQNFFWVLLGWAQRARRAAQLATRPIEPAQRELFE